MSSLEPRTLSAHPCIIALAASAGGLQVLSEVLAALPADLAAALVVVQHLDPHHRSHLAAILGRRTALRVKEAAEDDRLSEGLVLVAPPDRHLLVDAGGGVTLSSAELVHFVRPSADLLFESVAAGYGDRVIAVILTGTGKDGGMGVRAVKQQGGTVIVQDPIDAEFSGMPETAISTGAADLVLPLRKISETLLELVNGLTHEQH